MYTVQGTKVTEKYVKQLADHFNIKYEKNVQLTQCSLRASGTVLGRHLAINTWSPIKEEIDHDTTIGYNPNYGHNNQFDRQQGEYIHPVRRWITTWETSLTWFFPNPHKIELKIYPETIKSKIAKMFGMQDIQLYDEAFDKKFIIQSNNKTFALTAFPDHLRKALLEFEDMDYFGMIDLGGGQLVYKDTFFELSTPFNIQRIIRLAQATRVLVDAVTNYKP